MNDVMCVCTSGCFLLSQVKYVNTYSDGYYIHIELEVENPAYINVVYKKNNPDNINIPPSEFCQLWLEFKRGKIKQDLVYISTPESCQITLQ